MVTTRSKRSYRPIDHQRRIQGDIVPKKSVLDGIPLDVIFEIFSLLHPLDLARLTRTSKSLRNILISSASASVWRRARLAIDPSTPDCPPDLNEIRWVRTLYGTKCMICKSAWGPHTQWNLRLRGCSSCLDRVLIKHSQVFRTFPKIGDLIQLPEPSAKSRESKTMRHRRRMGQEFPQVEDVHELLRLLPFSRRTELPWKGGEPWYHRAAVKKIVDTLVSFQEEARSGIEGAQERLDAFKEARTQEVLSIMNPEPVLKQWIAPIENRRTGLGLGLRMAACGALRRLPPVRLWTGP